MIVVSDLYFVIYIVGMERGLQKEIVEYLRPKGAESIAVFGSYARGDEDEDSDIDILVEFSDSVSLKDLVKFERELGEILGIDVDLVTSDSLSPYIVDRVEEEQVVLA